MALRDRRPAHRLGPGRLLAVTLILAGVAWLASSGAAAAAPPATVSVVASTPAANARVGAAPQVVTLTFSRPVATTTVHILGPNGDRVDLDGTAVSSDGDRAVSVTMQSGGTGGYLVTWTAAPAGNPAPAATGGALAFAVGRVPAWAGGGTAQFLSAGGAGPALAAAVNGAEGIALAALLLLVGMVIGVTRGWIPSGHSTYAAVSALLLLVGGATAIGLALHGPFAAGLPVGQALSRTMARATLHTAWGIAGLIALAGVVIVGAVSAPLLLSRGRARSSRTERAALFGALVLSASVVLAGHGISGPLPGVWTVLVGLHVISVVVLAALLLARLVASRRSDEQKRQNTGDAEALRGATIAVIVTGLLLALHETGTLSAVTGTAYGRISLAKAAATVALLFAVFALTDGRPSRARGSQKSGPPRRKAGPTLVRAPDRTTARAPTRAKAEAAPVVAKPGAGRGDAGAIHPLGLAAVLFVLASLITAVLMFQTPGRLAAPRPATGTLLATGMDMEFQLSPARVGQNNLHLYILNGAGSPEAAPGASAQLLWSTATNAPLPVNLSDAGPGHFLDYGLEIPLAGSWILRVRVDVAGSTTQRSFSAPVTIHP